MIESTKAHSTPVVTTKSFEQLTTSRIVTTDLSSTSDYSTLSLDSRTSAVTIETTFSDFSTMTPKPADPDTVRFETRLRILADESLSEELLIATLIPNLKSVDDLRSKSSNWIFELAKEMSFATWAEVVDISVDHFEQEDLIEAVITLVFEKPLFYNISFEKLEKDEADMNRILKSVATRLLRKYSNGKLAINSIKTEARAFNSKTEIEDIQTEITTSTVIYPTESISLPNPLARNMLFDVGLGENFETEEEKEEFEYDEEIESEFENQSEVIAATISADGVIFENLTPCPSKICWEFENGQCRPKANSNCYKISCDSFGMKFDFIDELFGNSVNFEHFETERCLPKEHNGGWLLENSLGGDDCRKNVDFENIGG